MFSFLKIVLSVILGMFYQFQTWQYDYLKVSMSILNIVHILDLTILELYVFITYMNL